MLPAMLCGARRRPLVLQCSNASTAMVLQRSNSSRAVCCDAISSSLLVMQVAGSGAAMECSPAAPRAAVKHSRDGSRGCSVDVAMEGSPVAPVLRSSARRRLTVLHRNVCWWLGCSGWCWYGALGGSTRCCDGVLAGDSGVLRHRSRGGLGGAMRGKGRACVELSEG